jgi:hypothetical protein
MPIITPVSSSSKLSASYKLHYRNVIEGYVIFFECETFLDETKLGNTVLQEDMLHSLLQHLTP